MKLWFGEGVWTRKNTEKTAILRHAAFGDMVLTRRFVLEARKAFPQYRYHLSILPQPKRYAAAAQTYWLKH